MRVQTLVPSLIAACLVAVAASGATADPEPTPLPTTASATPAELAHAERLADDLLTASPADVLVRAAGEAGYTAAARPTPPPGDVALRAAGIDPADLPLHLVDPVGRLMAAIQTAEALRAEAVAGLSPEEAALVQGGALFAHDAVAPEPTPGASARLVTYTERYSDSERAAIAAKVDMAKMVTAAALILDTVRDVLPLLPATATSTDGAAACAVGPPTIYDSPGTLAIDDGDRRWTSDYTLILDLGGNDCHVNTAATGSGSIEVVVDAAGNDRYEETSTTGGVTGIGVGALGVGVLVDAQGDDAYVLRSERTSPQPGPVAGAASAIGQGTGALGVGAVVDGGGTDRFIAIATSSGGPALVAGQGGTNAPGVGVLVTGHGDTRYNAEARSTLHLVSQTPSQSTFSIGRGTVAVQGGGAGGAGALVDATGHDSYAAGTFGSEGTTVAQGAGSVGAGILVDGTGRDEYIAAAEGDVTLTLIVRDTNFCWTVTVNTVTSTTTTVAQGAAVTGAGVLADLSAGDTNRFEATARSAATSHAEVALSASSFCTNNAHATATTGTARVQAQGLGQTGAGVLIGGTGHDVYHVESGSTGTARALVRHGVIGANTASAQSGSAETRSHGLVDTGAGIIADAGGDDRYLHQGATSATQTTTTGGTVPGTAGTVSLVGEGWARTGVGWLLDLGGTDTYSTPSAGNDRCWTQPTSGSGDLDMGRGRDLSAPYLPLPTDCP